MPKLRTTPRSIHLLSRYWLSIVTALGAAVGILLLQSCASLNAAMGLPPPDPLDGGTQIPVDGMGTVRYLGEKMDGRPNGKGSVEYRRTPGKCVGTFVSGLNGDVACETRGEWSIDRFTGTLMAGQLKSGSRSVHSISKDGTIYSTRVESGQFEQDRLNGSGAVSWYRGVPAGNGAPPSDDPGNFVMRYETSFTDGVPLGNGKLVSSNGAVLDVAFDSISIEEPPVKLYAVHASTDEQRKFAKWMAEKIAAQARKVDEYNKALVADRIAAVARKKAEEEAQREEEERRYEEEQERKREERAADRAFLYAFLAQAPQVIAQSAAEVNQQQIDQNQRNQEMHERIAAQNRRQQATAQANYQAYVEQKASNTELSSTWFADAGSPAAAAPPTSVNPDKARQIYAQRDEAASQLSALKATEAAAQKKSTHTAPASAGNGVSTAQWLERLRGGIRLHALECYGQHYVVGSRPATKSPDGVSDCITVDYEARCPGVPRGQGVSGSIPNFTGGTGCYMETAPIGSKLNCTADSATVDVIDVRPGGC